MAETMITITPDMRERLRPYREAGKAFYLIFNHELRKEQVAIECTGCSKTVARCFKHGLNPNAFYKSFRNQGWEVDNRGKEAYCPACVAAPAKESAPPPKLPANQRFPFNGAMAAALNAAITPAKEPPPAPPVAVQPVDTAIIIPMPSRRDEYPAVFRFVPAHGGAGEDVSVRCANTPACAKEWRRPFRPELAPATMVWHLIVKANWAVRRGKKLAFCPSCAASLPRSLPAEWQPGMPLPERPPEEVVSAPAELPLPEHAVAEHPDETPDMFVKRVYGNAFRIDKYPDGELCLMLDCSKPACSQRLRSRFNPNESLAALQARLKQDYKWSLRNSGTWAFCTKCSTGLPHRLPVDWTPDKPLGGALTEENTMDARAPKPHENGHPHLVASNSIPSKPSADALAKRRRTNELLLEYYNPEGKCYRNGYSDARVAKESGLAEAAVTKIREEYYGPLEISAEVLKLIEALPLLKQELAAATSEVTEIRKFLDDSMQKLDTLTTKIDTICRCIRQSGLALPFQDQLSSGGSGSKRP